MTEETRNTGRDAVSPAEARPLVVAVAGNPNVGKSTLINAIAGTRLQVGNWPGVTVEKKEALFEHNGRKIRLVDLPGTYSLSPYTQEEIIARDYLVKQRPDLIVNVVDATNLERNLYLTVQLMELGIPVVMALNIYDEATAKGYRFNIGDMETMLGVGVVPTSATRKNGLAELLDRVLETAARPAEHAPRTLNYGDDIETAVALLGDTLRREHPALFGLYPERWLLLRLMEGDERLRRETNLAQDALPEEIFHHLRRGHGEDLEAVMADARYSQAAGLAREVLFRKEGRRVELTERIDRVVLNRFLGIPIFLAAMWLVFKLTFDLSKPFGDWIGDMAGGPFKHWTTIVLGLVGAPDWTVSLATEGVISGVGFVLVFVPVIFMMMFFITFLEGSGYMARAAFVMDRAMHAMGLHGKSFIPLLLGFGCNVPGIYATRTLENQRDKVLTALLIPLMSCGARLPVYVLFVGVFFPNNPGTVIWSLYVMGIALAIAMGVVFKRTLFRGEAPMFIMELPPYRMPSFTSLCLHTWEKGKHFLIKAGTYIFAVSIFVWFLLNLPWGVEHKKDSYLGQAGQVMAPVLSPLGFGTWQAASSLITGVIAKEIVVGTMGEIYAPRKEEEKKPEASFGEDLREIAVSFGKAAGESVANVVSTFGVSSLAADEKEDRGPLKATIRQTFTPLSAYAFMVFVLLYMPCVVVAIAMRQEFGGWKWFGVAFAYQSVLAWGMAMIVYQGGRLLGLGV
ncbi:ferrous iron transport protein B [Geobacter sp. AOG2]|uniref:ferrous iron transport protein B n=1 Tax=Geobacter sp. AOG2 TaxID=1566347 RepID=UPI001CC33A09|nr:ferrous iron transport protein B [Geobacter sp. AOG2]GFE62465.1 ferrous iron transport protein B [Geobacter sp. AOG2]